MLIINNKFFEQNRTNISPYWAPWVIYVISHVVSSLMMNFNLFSKPWFNNFLCEINCSCTTGWLTKSEMTPVFKCLTFVICLPITFVGVWWQNCGFLWPVLFTLKVLCQFPILNILGHIQWYTLLMVTFLGGSF